jgi:arginyl-tRNA synthetase
MLSAMKRELGKRLREHIRELFDVDHDPVIEVPPRRNLGDLAAPAALHLARTLKSKPRDIATRLAEGLALPRFVDRAQVQGAGYLNFYLHRGTFVQQLLEAPLISPSPESRGKVIVEHTNINPNKAAHIGHLRNAVLGDVLVRCLRSLGEEVEVQNYIDDTGVQLADVVVGFLDLRGVSLQEVADLPEPFDFLCWDLYSEVGRWYEEDPQRQALRNRTLRDLEEDRGERAEMGRLVSRRVLHRHLATMQRLGVGYDLLTHEGDILRLDFFSLAFEKLQQSGAVAQDKEGRNAGCWVMPLSQSQEFQGLEDPDKVIVRSDGTVTYVGKDIAYQLWKFGLLGLDFCYRRWQKENLWETSSDQATASSTHPAFGGGQRVINVIDARQSYLQKIVRAGLEALGHQVEAERSTHFAYEMVALSASTAQQLGFVSPQGCANADKTMEMSGRKGIGVKADDLLDQLEAKSRLEIAKRNRDLDSEELDRLATEIATAALRFFMVKATTTRVIVFDFDEALNFEGESGPYLQYSLVRTKNIQRRLHESGMATTVTPAEVEMISSDRWEDDLWDLIFGIAQIEEIVARAAASLELSLLARHAVDLAKKFHTFYHRHPILHESDPARRASRLATAQIFRRGLEELAGLLGLPIPDRM